MNGSKHQHNPTLGITAPSDSQIALTAKASAKALDVGLTTIWKLHRDGEIESLKIGRARRFTWSSLVAYAERRLKAERAESAA